MKPTSSLLKWPHGSVLSPIIALFEGIMQQLQAPVPGKLGRCANSSTTVSTGASAVITSTPSSGISLVHDNAPTVLGQSVSDTSLTPSDFLRRLESDVDLPDTSHVSATLSETARFLETLEDLPLSDDQSHTQLSLTNLPVLPPPDAPSPPSFTWGKLDAFSFTNSLEAAYNEVTHWRKNHFSVPLGNVGKKFVEELGRLFRAFAVGSALESVALRAITVMSILLLQKSSFNTKSKDDSLCLERRLKLWAEGDINALVVEGRSLQKHLVHKSSKQNQDNAFSRKFADLMFRGKVDAALDLLSNTSNGGTLNPADPSDSSDPSSPTVLDVLMKKHPPGQPVHPSVLIGEGEPPFVHPVLFDKIDGDVIKNAALNTKGAAGPSGLDAHCWRRLCTSFHSASRDLCHSLALFARRLCTSFVDPKALSPFLACRLIALDKCPGVRPIGICEAARRIVSKAILFIFRDDIQDAAGSIQLCAGQIAGVEAAIHFMRETYSAEDCEAVILVDASNAFNSLNRECALLNIRFVCPPLATVLINTYRNATELFVGGNTLFSAEGTTQGDPLAMPMYAMATIPLVTHLSYSSDAKQVWYADDSSAAGSLDSISLWWKSLQHHGPLFGYFINPSKTWLLTKAEHLDKAEALFQNTQVNITTQGRPYLGAPLGNPDYVQSFVSNKVNSWMEEINVLSDVALSQPHAALAAFTHGMIHKFTYLCRTTPDIDQLLSPLENLIRSRLLPAVWSTLSMVSQCFYYPNEHH